MKKILYICLLGLLCSCAKELSTINDSKPAEQGSITFSATMEGVRSDGSTKACIGEDNSVIWNEGDSISILDVNNSPSASRFDIVSGAGTTTAAFHGNCLPTEVGYYAVYPYSSKTYLSKYTSCFRPDIWWDGSTQTAYDGNIDPKKHIMVAYGTAEYFASEVSLEFKNVLAYLKFTIDYKCKSVVIKTGDSTDYIACSSFESATESDGSLSLGIVNDRTDEITLTAPDGGIISAGTYYIGVLPKTYPDGFTMTFTSAADDGKTCQKTKKSSCTFERNKIYNLGTIDLYDIAKLDGSGTSDDPYIISDYSDLKLMQEKIDRNVSGYVSAYYKQVNDIDIKGKELVPMGSDNYFKGTYDGGKHKISNPLYQRASVGTIEFDVAALFACISNATIKDLTVCNPDFYNDSSSKIHILSAFVGLAASDDGNNKISGCHAVQSPGDTLRVAYGMRYRYGAILGVNSSDITISECSSDLNVKFTFVKQSYYPYLEAGGILGYTQTANVIAGAHKAGTSGHTYIDRCRNSGSLTLDCNGTVEDNMSTIFMGGILGVAWEDALCGDVCTSITNCVNSGVLKIEKLIKEKECYLGGIVGQGDSDGWSDNRPSIINCLSKGNLITSCDGIHLGGLMGNCYDDDTSFKYCATLAKTNVDDGYDTADHGTYTSCYTNQVWKNSNGCSFKLIITADFMNSLGADGLYAAWTTNTSGLDLDI